MAVHHAMKRNKLSAPTKFLLGWHNFNYMLSWDEPVLDFGCGYGFDCDNLRDQGYKIDGYDKFFRPHGIRPRYEYNTIICNYVLNCISKKDQLSVLKEIYGLISRDGVVYITIRKDVKNQVKLDAPVCHQTGWYRMYRLTKKELGKIL